MFCNQPGFHMGADRHDLDEKRKNGRSRCAASGRLRGPEDAEKAFRTPSGVFKKEREGGQPQRHLFQDASTGDDHPRPDEAVVPGINPVLELLRTQPERVDSVFVRKGRQDKRVQEILTLCRQRGIRFALTVSDALNRLYPGVHQGVVARLLSAVNTGFDELCEKAKAAPLPLIIALDQVMDPGNVGTLARTLYAMGGAGLLLPRHNSAYLGPQAAKASAGALLHLPVCKVSNLGQALDKIAKCGFFLYGASGSSSDSVNAYKWQPQFPAVLVLGGEEDGIRQSVAKRCDALIRIPMPGGFESLNVAQAGAVLLALCARLRHPE